MDERKKILTDEDIMLEYHVTKGYLNRNSKKLGAFGRPRKYFNDIVEAFFRGLAEKSLQASQIESQRKDNNREIIKNLLEASIAHHRLQRNR